jgi:hypothetical protein
VDNTLATALIDRLMHHGKALVIKGDSYGSPFPGPGPVLPAAPLQALGPSTQAILAEERNPRRNASAVVPNTCARFSGREHKTPAAPLHAASNHYCWPTLTPRFQPRAERRCRAP